MFLTLCIPAAACLCFYGMMSQAYIFLTSGWNLMRHALHTAPSGVCVCLHTDTFLQGVRIWSETPHLPLRLWPFIFFLLFLLFGGAVGPMLFLPHLSLQLFHYLPPSLHTLSCNFHVYVLKKNHPEAQISTVEDSCSFRTSPWPLRSMITQKMSH